jgi:hypothetical protein
MSLGVEPLRFEMPNATNKKHPQGVLFLLVGVRGFEPPASSSRTKRATRLRYTPNVWENISLQKVDGRGERIRTSDLLHPKQLRYQAALHPALHREPKPACEEARLLTPSGGKSKPP